jgi:Zn-dependent metalloprotease
MKMKAKVEMKKKGGVPHRIYDVESKAKQAPPQEIAEKALQKIAKDLKIDPDLSQLKFHEVKDSMLGKHVLYQQQQDGQPISGAWVRVDIDDEGKIYNIQNDLVPAPVIDKAEKMKAKKAKNANQQLSLGEASDIALKALKVKNKADASIVDSEFTWYTHEGIPVLSWKIVVSGKKVGEWKFYIDALTKKILKKINLVKSAVAKGRVFDPNPVVKLNGVKLTERSKIPDEAYIEVELKGLDKSGRLNGIYVNTSKTKNRVKRSNLEFLFKKEQRAFKEVMVYYHIDKMQRYIQELGFKNVMNKPIAVDIDGERDDNSYYFPESKSLQFGIGGVDDAEDAEVIIHEYAHAIQDDIVPGFGPEGEACAMGEGFGDYLAASFFSSNKPASFRPAFATWDAYFKGSGKPKSWRRLDSPKKYPRDIRHDVHADGEIWSSSLWDIRNALGGRQTDKLVIAHHFLLTPKATFADAAKALITTDKRLNKGANEKMILDVFVKRGILPRTKKKNK